MSEEKTRICRTCKQAKPFSQFGRNYQHRETIVYRFVCLDCRTKRNNETRKKNAEGDVRWINFLYPLRCGGCGKPIRFASRNRGYLCLTCSRVAQDNKAYQKLYEEVMGRESAAIASCPNCAFLLVCQVRLQAGLWMVCEMPDRADLNRAQAVGIETDGHDIILSKDQIKNKTVWPAWWPNEVNIGDNQPLVVERVNHERLR